MYYCLSNTCFCTHHPQEPHSVTVVVPGSVMKMITVKCDEPQRIYDLLKKHGVTSSNVWDSKIALSARSPCTALCDHNMTMVYVNRISCYDTFAEEPEVSTFYHNMKYVRIQTKRRVLRHKPYTMPLRSAVDNLPHTAPSLTRTISTESIPAALYYEDNMSRMSDVIEADGRFLPSLQCMDRQGDDGDRYVAEVQPDTDLIIVGRSRLLYVHLHTHYICYIYETVPPNPL